jgi:hypothetical protein
MPSSEVRDLRQLLLHRYKLVMIRARVKNELQHSFHQPSKGSGAYAPPSRTMPLTEPSLLSRGHLSVEVSTPLRAGSLY